MSAATTPEERITLHGVEYHGHTLTFTTDNLRVQIVKSRDRKGVWSERVLVFPETENPLTVEGAGRSAVVHIEVSL